jgi:hypothetical protein
VVSKDIPRSHVVNVVQPVPVTEPSSFIPITRMKVVEKSLQQPSTVYLLAACRDASLQKEPHDINNVNQNLLRFVVDRAPDYPLKKRLIRTIPVTRSSNQNTYFVKVQ